MKKLLSLALLVLCSMPLLAQSGKLVQRGPFYVSYDTDLMIGDNNRLFATSNGGLFYTDDREHWNFININVRSAPRLTKDLDGNIYVYTRNGGIYRSTDNGATWKDSFYLYRVEGSEEYTALYTNSNFRIQHDTVFVGSHQGIGYVSVNGPTYSGVQIKRMVNKQIQAIEVQGDRIVAIELSDSVHVSDDRGVTWTSRHVPFDIHISSYLAILGKKIFVNSNETWVSDNEGEDWEINLNDVEGGLTELKTIEGKVYGIGGYKTYEFSVEDDKWIPINADEGVTVGLAIKDDDIFLAKDAILNDEGKFIESTNGGDTWDEISRNGYTSGYVQQLEIDSDSTIYAATANTVYRKKKGDSEFELLVENGGRRILVDGDVIYTPDYPGIQKWNKATSELIEEIEIDNNGSPDHIVKVSTTIFINMGPGGVWRLEANGVVTNFSTGLEGREVLQLAASSSALYARTDNGVYMSAASVPTWHKLQITSGPNYIASIYVNDQIVMVFGDKNRLSRDGGTSWEAISIASPLDAVSYANGRYYGITFGKVAVSTNGSNWTTTPFGSDFLLYPMSLVATKDSIFVGTVGNGIYSMKNLKFQNIVFDSIPSVALDQSTLALNAVSTESLPVEFVSNNTDRLTISGTTATLLKAGRVWITAKQQGSSTTWDAEPVMRFFCIVPAKPVITTSNLTTDSVKLTATAGENYYYYWYHDDEEPTYSTGNTFVAKVDGNYTVVAATEDCRSEASDPVNFVITGLGDEPGNGIKVYPNPAKEELFLKTTQPATVTIIDVTGRVIGQYPVSENSDHRFDISSFSQGLYFLRIQNTDGVTTKRFSKQ